MEKNISPDMIKYSEIITAITAYPKIFKSDKDMADLIRRINSLQKYDLKPVADNITNNNTNINVVADNKDVKDLIKKLRERGKTL